MYSKPKGMYIKQRDKPARRLSPRDDTDGADQTEGRQSPRVDVENFGIGEINPDMEPEWPKRNFEHDDNPPMSSHYTASGKDGSNQPKPGPSHDEENYPSRAKQYMVKTNSYKELTGTKYITVPEPKHSHTKKVSPRPKPAGSVRSFGLTESLKLLQDARTSSHVAGGSIHDHPNHLVANKSHIATIRLPKKRSTTRHRNRMATIKAIPRDGTVKRVKGYHVGQNATVRVHNTGHAIRHLKHAMSSWDNPDAAAFKRSNILADRKDVYITQFAIELDQSERDAFIPGEMLSGRVILESTANIEIRFVELLIIGVATVNFSKNDPALANQGQEVLINKRSYMMGTPDGRWNSVITAGKYVSKFRFKLPNNLPSTQKYENKESGFSFEINYIVKARICDEMGSSSVRSVHSINNYVKVLLSRRFPFMVRSPFDVHSIPNAMKPIQYSEFVNLSCLPIFFDTANIVLSLDRSVFLAGDEIHVKLTTAAKTSRKIQTITCDLNMRVHSKLNMRQTFNIVQIHEHEPQGMLYQQDSKNYVLFDFIVPTKAQFVTTYLSGCGLIRVGYSIVITVKFKSCSGSLFLECPIGIGPCADPLSPNDTTSLPVFNRPKRFPHFSKDTKKHHPTITKNQNGAAHIPHTGEKQVTSTYKHKGAQLCCCCIDEDDL